MLNLRGGRGVNKFTAVAAALKETGKKKEERKKQNEAERKKERKKKKYARARGGLEFFSRHERGTEMRDAVARSSVAGDDEVFRYTMKSPAHVFPPPLRPVFSRPRPPPPRATCKQDFETTRGRAAPRRVASRRRTKGRMIFLLGVRVRKSSKPCRKD